MKIDLHTHILPKNWEDLKSKYGYGGWVRLEHFKKGCARMMIDNKFFREIQENCWDEETRIRECDSMNIKMQTLSTVPVMFSYWAKKLDALDISQFLNDHIAEIVIKYPKRFSGLGTIPMQAPNLAAIELQRCMLDLGLRGIQIGTNVNGINLDDEMFYPIWEMAEKTGASIFVHPWDVMSKERMQRYWMQWLVGMPSETTISIMSLIFGGVIDKFPNVKFCFAHGGGSFLTTFARIRHGFFARPDLMQLNTEKDPIDYIKNLYFDTLVHDPIVLNLMINMVSENQIALGSDYPFPLGELYAGELVESMTELSNETKQRLLSGTALEFLNLKKEFII